VYPQKNVSMQRLGKNHGGYHGETIDVRAVLRDIETAGRQHGWTAEVFGQQGEFNLLALHRLPLSLRTPHSALRIYLSAGIHGDEPAGPVAALRLLRENHWPENAELWFCPCLNPTGFALNRRENAAGRDLNRDYRHGETAEVRAHIAWLERQPKFDLCLCLHEDWESHGFYIYELNPDHRPSLAETMMAHIGKVCPIDPSAFIEGREAKGGIIRPNLDPRTRPQWAEAFYLIVNKTRYSCTLEAPSDFPLPTRVNALVTGVNTALETFLPKSSG
jgi:murein peptide amidase A